MAKRAKGKGPHIPQPDPEAVKRGVPSTRKGYIRDGVPTYKHKNGKNRIRFFAWKDGVHFFYYLYTHASIGIENDSFACLVKNWGEPDPICQDAQKQLDSGVPWEDVFDQGILVKKYPRILAQIVDRDDEAKGIQIWDVTSRDIDGAVRSLSIDDDTGAVIPWTDPANGYDLIYDFDVSEQYKMPKNLRRSPNPSVIDIGFYDQIMDFEEEVIYKPTWEEMATSFQAIDEEPEPGSYDGPEIEEEVEPEVEAEAVMPTPEEMSAGDDPLGEEDCFGKAYGYYDDCIEGAGGCPYYEKCKKDKAWTGTKCSECGLPQFKTDSGDVCALGHGSAPPKRRRRPKK
jgi:hypothetical protein